MANPTDPDPVSAFNFISPFSEVSKYVGPPKRGFLCKPTSDDAPDGWGEPFRNEDGSPNYPGTPGGDNPCKLLAKPDDGWKAQHTPGNQLYGPISWQGKLKQEDDPGKGKWVLTYWGPPGRYFPSSEFQYGDDDKHNDIYCEGLCIAVAPEPVLGAALRVEHPGGGKPVVYKLVVICKKWPEDIAYIREVQPWKGANAEKYNDEFRNAQMEKYDEEKNPKGWRTLGTFKCDDSNQGIERDVKEPRTPWFFDSTGTVAQCMREADITLLREEAKPPVKEYGLVRYKVTVSNTDARKTLVDNEPPFEWSVRTIVSPTYRKVYKAESTRWPTAYGQYGPHWWKEWGVAMYFAGSGKYVLAVDYEDTQEKLMKLDLDDSAHWMIQCFYKGVDDEYQAQWPEQVPPYSPNTGSWLGDLDKALAEDYVPAQFDGTVTNWEGISHWYKIDCDGFEKFHIFRYINGTKKQFDDGGEQDPEDPWLYFTWFARTYPHHIDISRPRPHLSAFQDQWVWQTPKGVGEKKFGYNQELYTREDGITNKNVEVFMEKQLDPEVLGPGTGNGWTVTELLEWIKDDKRIDETRTIKTLAGRIPDDLAYTEGNPTPYGFYRLRPFAFLEEVPAIWDLFLTPERNEREMGHACYGDDHHVFSVKYLDENDEPAYYNTLDGDTGVLTEKTKAGGKTVRFYPIGES